MTIPLDRHWKNVFWILSVETFWGVALALISVVAILPVFLTQLGATNTVIGALPVIWTLATNLPGALASHFTGGLALRRRRVIWLHVISAVPWILAAAWFGIGGRHQPALDIAVFLAAWGGAWVLMGFTIPVWVNFIGKVTRRELRARSFGTIFFFQTLMGIVGGWVANRILASPIPFPQNYALGFLVAAFCMAAGSFFFLPVVEESGAVTERGQALESVIRHAREILSDRGGVRVYLASLLFSVGGWLLVTYYPVFAQRRFELTPRDSATFTAVCMGGQMIGSVLTGMIGDRFGYRRVAVIAMGALSAGLALAVFGGRRELYYVTAFALGVYLVADRIALMNLSMAFSPHEDNTAYLGVIPALVAPALALMAGSAGSLIDRFGFLPVGYVGLAGAIVALYLVMVRLPEPAYSLAGKRGAS
jgi:predicted MFS family arabinose efflux permease